MCPPKWRLPMCPSKTRAGRARFWTATRVGRAAHTAVSMGCPHQVPIANVPFTNACVLRAFSGFREAVGCSVPTAPPLLNSRCTQCQCVGYGTADARNGRFLNGEFRLTRTADLWNVTIWHHSMESQLEWTKGGACFRKVKRRLSCSTALRTM